MRRRGTITFWKDEKGYGFITPEAGGKQVFVHARAFIGQQRRPDLNQLVSYSLSTDKQGRACAVKVTRPREQLPARAKSNYKTQQFLIAVTFIMIVGVSVLTGYMPPQVLFTYLAASLLTFFIYAWDKSSAIAGAQRTAESSLHLLSLLGGWPGAIIAQQTLRHKSSKEEFRNVFWITVFLNCGFFVWFFTETGADMLKALIGVASG